jgi:hypothetical protein
MADVDDFEKIVRETMKSRAAARPRRVKLED